MQGGCLTRVHFKKEHRCFCRKWLKLNSHFRIKKHRCALCRYSTGATVEAKHAKARQSSRSRRLVSPATHLLPPDLLGELARRHQQQRVADGRELRPGHSGTSSGHEPEQREEGSHERPEEPHLKLLHSAQRHVSTAEGGRQVFECLRSKPPSIQFLCYIPRYAYGDIRLAQASGAGDRNYIVWASK